MSKKCSFLASSESLNDSEHEVAPHHVTLGHHLCPPYTISRLNHHQHPMPPDSIPESESSPSPSPIPFIFLSSPPATCDLKDGHPFCSSPVTKECAPLHERESDVDDDSALQVISSHPTGDVDSPITSSSDTISNPMPSQSSPSHSNHHIMISDGDGDVYADPVEEEDEEPRIVDDDDEDEIDEEDNDDERDGEESIYENICAKSQIDWVIGEILDTETSYVHDLRQIIRGYVHVLRSRSVCERNFPLTPEEISHFFGNIESVYLFSHDFMTQLEKCGLNVTLISQVFIDNSSRFDVYTNYCTIQYPKSLSMLSTWMKDPHIRDILQQIQCNLDHNLPLGSYMLKPVQRILKYPLFLQNIVKHTDASSEEGIRTKEALDLVTNYATHINDIKRKHELFMRAQFIQSHLQGFNEVEWKLLGELISEGNFNTYPAKDVRYLFLFQKGLLITKRKRDDLFVYKTHIDSANLMLIESITGHKKCFNVIDFKSPRTHLCLMSDTLDRKRQWCQLIKKVILDNYQALIPSQAKDILMTLGQKGEETQSNEDTNGFNGTKKSFLSADYLEKRKSHQDRRRKTVTDVSSSIFHKKGFKLRNSLRRMYSLEDKIEGKTSPLPSVSKLEPSSASTCSLPHVGEEDKDEPPRRPSLSLQHELQLGNRSLNGNGNLIGSQSNSWGEHQMSLMGHREDEEEPHHHHYDYHNIDPHMELRHLLNLRPPPQTFIPKMMSMTLAMTSPLMEIIPSTYLQSTMSSSTESKIEESNKETQDDGDPHEGEDLDQLNHLSITGCSNSLKRKSSNAGDSGIFHCVCNDSSCFRNSTSTSLSFGSSCLSMASSHLSTDEMMYHMTSSLSPSCPHNSGETMHGCPSGQSVQGSSLIRRVQSMNQQPKPKVTRIPACNLQQTQSFRHAPALGHNEMPPKSIMSPPSPPTSTHEKYRPRSLSQYDLHQGLSPAPSVQTLVASEDTRKSDLKGGSLPRNFPSMSIHANDGDYDDDVVVSMVNSDHSSIDQLIPTS